MGTSTSFDPAIFEEIAESLHVDVTALERDSLRVFLERQLAHLKAEQFRIAGKYGIRTVDEMEQRYREQRLAEQDTWEDFFELDHIEAEIGVIERALEKL